MASVRIYHQPSGSDAAVRIARALYAQGFEISTLEQEKFPMAGSMAPALAAAARGFDVAIAVIPENVDREVWIRGELSMQAHLHPQWLVALGPNVPMTDRERERAFLIGDDPGRHVLASMFRQGKDPRRPSPSPRRPQKGTMEPFDPTAMVRAAVEQQRPPALVGALANLREASEDNGTVLFGEPLDLQSASARWQFVDMPWPSIIDSRGRIIILGVLLDGRILTADVAELNIRKEGGVFHVGGPATTTPATPELLGARRPPDDEEALESIEPEESLDDAEPIEPEESLDEADLIEAEDAGDYLDSSDLEEDAPAKPAVGPPARRVVTPAKPVVGLPAKSAPRAPSKRDERKARRAERSAAKLEAILAAGAARPAIVRYVMMPASFPGHQYLARRLGRDRNSSPWVALATVRQGKLDLFPRDGIQPDRFQEMRIQADAHVLTQVTRWFVQASNVVQGMGRRPIEAIASGDPDPFVPQVALTPNYGIAMWHEGRVVPDDYTPERILSPLAMQMAHQVLDAGSLVVTMPRRGLLLAAPCDPSDDDTALFAVRQAYEICVQSSFLAISHHAFIVQDGRVVGESNGRYVEMFEKAVKKIDPWGPKW